MSLGWSEIYLKADGRRLDICYFDRVGSSVASILTSFKNWKIHNVDIKYTCGLQYPDPARHHLYPLWCAGVVGVHCGGWIIIFISKFNWSLHVVVHCLYFVVAFHFVSSKSSRIIFQSESLFISCFHRILLCCLCCGEEKEEDKLRPFFPVTESGSWCKNILKHLQYLVFTRHTTSLWITQ